MKHNFLKSILALLLIGVTLTYVGCKDYDDDIGNVSTELTETAAALQQQLSTLQTALQNAQADATAAAQAAAAAKEAADKAAQAAAAAQQAVAQAKAEAIEEAEIQIKYKGYIEREKFIAEKLHRLENIRIPEDFDFHSMNSLTIEARQKLTRIRPATIGQASRIPGVSPADVNVLLVKFGR